MLHVQVSRLRKALDRDGRGQARVIARAPGYVLRVEPGELDLERFEELLAQGHHASEAGEFEQASRALREAESLWRGRPLADLEFEPFARIEVERLEELRLLAAEERIDAELALGHHARLVAELEARVAEWPLRERLRGQLMLALYRCGRQADALEVYRAGRARLSEELALEPGPGLRSLEESILRQEPALELPERESGALATEILAPVPAAPRERSPAQATRAVASARHYRRRAAWGLTALGVAAVAVVVAVLARPGASTVRVAPNEVAAIDVRSDRVLDAIPVGDRPTGIAFGSGSLWVANLDDQTISRVDPNSVRRLSMIPVGAPPTGIAAGPRGVWVVESPGTSRVLVGRVDPVFDTIGTVARIGNVVPSGPGTIATQGNSVWVAPSTGLLTRFDGTTGKPAGQLDPNASPAGIAIGAGATWLTDTDADVVVRVDPSGLLTPIPVGNKPTGIAVGGGGVWVADSLDDAVVRIDPDTRSVTATIPVGRAPAGVAWGAGSVWVADSGDGTVTRIDPRTQRVRATIMVGGSPQAITIADGKAWVTVDEQSIPPSRGAPDRGTLRIVSSSDVPSLDSASAFGGLSSQLLYATCAQLLNYPDKSGPAGSQLTPEVAQSAPVRSPDGRTYAFKIRSGYRFSPPSNAPVTAQSFKATIERTLNPRMHSPYAHWLADVVGADAYMSGKASHIAGVVANGDTLTVRLLAPAPDFLARLSQPAGSCAVPSNTPVNRNGENVIPSAGPYYVKSYTPGQGIVLMRNPNYHGHRLHQFARIELVVSGSPPSGRSARSKPAWPTTPPSA